MKSFHYTSLFFTGFSLVIFISFAGTAYPALRGGVIVLNLMAVAALLAFALFCIAAARARSGYYFTSAQMAIACVPAAIGGLFLLIANCLGIWVGAQ